MNWSDFGLNGEQDLKSCKYTGQVLGTVKILGFHPTLKTGGFRTYIGICNICKEDKELFGDGLFKLSCYGTRGGGLRYSCGCDKKYRFSESQYRVLAKRVCKEKGYKFLGWNGEFNNGRTKVIIESPFGITDSKLLRNLLVGGLCSLEANAVRGIKNSIPDDEAIKRFKDNFHKDSKFWKSDRKTNRISYYWVECGECGQRGESTASDLRLGKHPCECSPSRQKECYLNLVDGGSGEFYLKFGIANNSLNRIKDQNRNNTLKMYQHCVYEFTTKQQCLQAERECLDELDTGVVDKELMPDGYTETTYVSNLEKIIEIYERNGGVRKD